MFKRKWLPTAILAASSLWAANALAAAGAEADPQAATRTQTSTPAPASTQSGAQRSGPDQSTEPVARTSDWMGRTVTGRDGEEIGNVTDFAFRPGTGEIAYVVVTLSGPAVQEHIAVRFEDLRATGDNDALQLPVASGAWESAERFATSGEWPRQATLNPSGSTREEAGVSPFAAESPASNASFGIDRTGSSGSASEAAFAERDALHQRIDGRNADARRHSEFLRLDRDGDGYLSRSELQAGAGVQASYRDLDADGDGKVSRTEFAAFEPIEYRRRSDDPGVDVPPAGKRPGVQATDRSIDANRGPQPTP